MKKFFVMFLAALGLVMVPSCDSPAAYSAAANLGGEAAAMLFVQLKKPTQAQVASLQTVVGQIDTCLQGYQVGNFTGAVPAILAAVDPTLKNDPVLMDMVNGLVPVICSQLDLLFARNPSWQASGISSAQLVDSLCQGVIAGLPVYSAQLNATNTTVKPTASAPVTVKAAVVPATK